MERVGRRYGILGFEKATKPLTDHAEEVDIDAVVATSGAAGKVTNAIAAYVVVKVSLGSSKSRLMIGFAACTHSGVCRRIASIREICVGALSSPCG